MDMRSEGVASYTQLIEALGLANRIIENSNDIIVVSEAMPIDQPGPRIIYVNKAFVKATGFTEQEAIGKTPRILQGPKTDQTTLGRIRSALQKWQPIREEVLNYKKNGEEFWQELNIFPVANESGRYSHWVAIQHNITERKVAEQALLESERRMALAAKAGGIGIWDWDMKNNCLSWDHQMHVLYGIEKEDFAGTYDAWYALVHPEDRKIIDEAISQAINTGEFNAEFRIIRPDQSICHIHGSAVVMKDDLEVAIRMIGTNLDVTESKLAQDEIKELAFYDPLTKLVNRRLFEDRLNHKLLRVQRSQHFNALLIIDLDHFKEINDSYGHQLGDLKLIDTARRIKGCVRETDTVARIGGDEFAIILSELAEDQTKAGMEVKKIAEKLCKSLSMTNYLVDLTKKMGKSSETIKDRTSVSIGITLFQDGRASQEQLISEADTAMYQAKRSGGNQFKLHESDIQE